MSLQEAATAVEAAVVSRIFEIATNLCGQQAQHEHNFKTPMGGCNCLESTNSLQTQQQQTQHHTTSKLQADTVLCHLRAVPELFWVSTPLGATVVHCSEIGAPEFGVAAAVWVITVTLDAGRVTLVAGEVVPEGDKQ
jgi:hypothetical protein